jgi:hypothetical protein
MPSVSALLSLVLVLSVLMAVIPGLREDIRAWRKGDPLPEALVNFPKPKRDPSFFRCGMMLSGEYVSHYIYEIHNPDLLEALVLEPRSGDDTLLASLKQLLRCAGIARTAAFVADAERTHPHLLNRPTFVEYRDGLRMPNVRLKIARFDKDRPVPLERAWQVITAMQADLRWGKDWKAAYATASEALRDESHHKPGEEFHGPTHLSYALDGMAAPNYKDLLNGVDLRAYEYATVPDGHLNVIFQAKGGTHILETDKAIWLYHVEEYFSGP